jgi:hypothetical protein
MSLRLRSWLIGGLALLAPPAVLAHHSVAYYSTDRTELVGEIAEIQRQNRHISFALRVVDSDGGQKTWRLIRNSWLAYGDTIRRYDCRKAN